MILSFSEVSDVARLAECQWISIWTLLTAHRVFANLKRWALGVYHGLRKKQDAKRSEADEANRELFTLSELLRSARNDNVLEFRSSQTL